MLRKLYTIAMYALVPWIILRLLWKSRHFPAYRQRIAERFTLGVPHAAPVDVWLHAVSMGEVVAATPLIERMLANKLRVLVTTMTPSGAQQVVTRFKSQVRHQYLPYDLPWCLRRFFKNLDPKIGIIMETELWPNLIEEAFRAKIPLMLVNARLSDRAFDKYKQLRGLLAPTLSHFSWIGAQSALDAERYQSLGALSARVVGNIKFDLSWIPAYSDAVRQLKSAWGDTRVVWIAASTHDDEELQILQQLALLQRAIPDIILLIAPRRPERFAMVYALVQSQGWRTGLRSEPASIHPDTEVLVLDCMGELMDFYQISDYAFVGGSLVPIGGHNVLEPIALQVPVFCGPFMQNSKAICEALVANHALCQGQSAPELVSHLIAMHHNPAQRQLQIANATAVLVANRGTADRYWEKILEIGAFAQS